MREFKISATELAVLSFMAGDLDLSFKSSKAMIDGTIIHQIIQNKHLKESKKAKTTYEKEVYLSNNFSYEDIDFTIQGRADGVFTYDDNRKVIEEIKSTAIENIENENPSHMAQLKIYSYLYMKEFQREEIEIRLLYCHRESFQTTKFEHKMTFAESCDFVRSLFENCYSFFDLMISNQELKNTSLEHLRFPYSDYRPRQRKIAVAVYKTIRESKKILIEAATGTGKTISVLFPTLKSMSKGMSRKIFYLTAKNLNGKACEDVILLMLEKGLELKTLILTAKDKICFKEESICEPDFCEYTIDYYSKLRPALEDILKRENMLSKAVIERYAEKYKICPFEFSLELIKWVDLIICDYNYFFDPKVSLKNEFASKTDYCLLIDEAHNLVDRSRDMFSSKLSDATCDLAVQTFEDENEIKDMFLSLKKALFSVEIQEEETLVLAEYPKNLQNKVKKLLDALEDYMNEHAEYAVEVKEIFFSLLDFMRISDLYCEDYKIYYEKTANELCLNLFCMNPANLLSKSYEMVKSVVFFSATLSPQAYYKEILGLDKDDYTMRVDSFFPKENFALLINGNIDTRFRKRHLSFNKIAKNIEILVSSKAGNYMVFFPSYKYLEDTVVFFENSVGCEILCQKAMMNNQEREEFLDKFTEDSRITAFAVMGGVFSESIDMLGEKLIGIVVVGPGLPGLSAEKDFIKEHFNVLKNKGHEYAYQYPGMNKVLQAGGRLIRSENDRGILLLIDDRFLLRSYKSLFPIHWSNFQLVDENTLEKKLKTFWS